MCWLPKLADVALKLLHATRYPPPLDMVALHRQRVISDRGRERRDVNSFRARRQALAPDLATTHNVPLMHQRGPRCSTIVSKKSDRGQFVSSCRFRAFCDFCQVVLGHGTSKPCPYKYINSAIPCSVLWFVEGFKLTNRNPSKCRSSAIPLSFFLVPGRSLACCMFQTGCFNVHVTCDGKRMAVLLGRACGWGVLEIAEQALQAFLVRIVVFPAGKVSDMSHPSDVSCPWQVCLLDHLIQGDGKEGRFVAALFFLKGGHDLSFYPLAIDGVFRKHHQELVIQADRLVNAVPELLPNFQVLRSKPASNVFGLQVGIESLGKRLILTGIADKAGVVLDRVLRQGMGIGDEGLSDTCFAQEHLRNVAFRPRDGICANGRRGIMGHCFQSFDDSQINISKDRLSYVGSAEVSSAEVSSHEVGSAEGGSGEVGSAEVGSAEMGVAKVGSAEVGSAEVGSAEVGRAEVGSAEVGSYKNGSYKNGSAEVGSAEGGSAEVGSEKVGSAKVGSVSAKVGSVGVGCAEGGSAEVGFEKGGCSEVGSAEVKVYKWIFDSPCIPDLYSLMEKIKLLLVCHSVHLLCGALIIERHRSICKMTPFCFIFPGLCGGIHCDLFFVRLETQCLNADFVRGVL
jgi:hypothetical protein